MKSLYLSIVFLCSVSLSVNAQEAKSPNGKLTAKTIGNKLIISYEKKQVLELADIPFEKLDFVRKVEDDYRMLKESACTVLTRPMSIALR